MKSKKSSINPKKLSLSPRRKLDACAQAAEELQRLRRVAREAHQHALARMEADIVHVLHSITPGYGASSYIRPSRDLRRIAKRVEQLDINPFRGRGKDLRRLNKLVSRLTEIVDQW